LDAADGGEVAVGRRAVAPAGEIAAVEETHKAGLGREGVGLAFGEAERGEDGPEGGGEFRVAGGVGVQRFARRRTVSKCRGR
jgi:hypothetical protein